MKVVEVRESITAELSYTVLSVNGAIAPIERYLSYLTSIERSPNTIKAQAHDLKDWFTFLEYSDKDWQLVQLEDLGAFIRWLKLPPLLRDQDEVASVVGNPYCGASSINRKLSTISSFYEHAFRHGIDLKHLNIHWDANANTSSWKPFLNHISKNASKPRRNIKLPESRRIPRLLTDHQIQIILNACEHRRDRLLFGLLYCSGLRIGEALGLRHEDLKIAESEVAVIRRINANRARAKSQEPRRVPVPSSVMRLYIDYLETEYGDLDNDYVFVQLWSRKHGQPLTYSAAYDLVLRLRKRTGIDFQLHWFRHTYATRLLIDGVPIEVTAKLLGHSTITTTSNTYTHFTSLDTRNALEAAGWFTRSEVRI